jgi:hypothetical protein
MQRAEFDYVIAAATLAVIASTNAGCTLHVSHSCHNSEDCFSGQCVAGTCYELTGDGPSTDASDEGIIDARFDGVDSSVDGSAILDAGDARSDAPDSSIKPDVSTPRPDAPDSPSGDMSFETPDAGVDHTSVDDAPDASADEPSLGSAFTDDAPSNPDSPDDDGGDSSPPSNQRALAEAGTRTFVEASTLAADQGTTATSFPCGPAWPAWPMPQPQSLTGTPSDPQKNLPNPQTYDVTNPDVVIDSVTHLTWQKEVAPNSFTFAQAQIYCASLQLANRNDWRLPSRIELASLLDITQSRTGYINRTAFADAPLDIFWTCSSGPANPLTVWYVGFNDVGDVNIEDKLSSSRARCVAGSTDVTPPPTRYAINAAQTEVYDLETGLTWQRSTAPSGFYIWGDGFSYCQSLGAGWRLPSVTELYTIVDEKQSFSAVDATAFPDRPNGNYWSSSYFDNNGTEAWWVALGYGNAFHAHVSEVQLVRCVL